MKNRLQKSLKMFELQGFGVIFRMAKQGKSISACQGMIVKMETF